MRRRDVRMLPLLALLAAGCGQGPMEAVRNDRWADAARGIAASADPVAGKLVTYFRMLAPDGGAGAGEIAAFIDADPNWPNQGLLARRREEALAREPDQAAAIAQCDRAPLALAAALLRCAEAYTAAGRPDDAARAVRQAWIGAGIADPAAETGFLRRWGAVVNGADQWTRFTALLPAHPAVAARQIARLEPGERPLAQLRLAFRRDDANALARLATGPAGAATDPGLMLDEAAWLRRHDLLAEARDLWLARGQTAAGAAPPERRAAYATERNQLARRLSRAGDDRGAYAVIDEPGAETGEPGVEAAFLAGFIALRRLHDPAAAERHFAALADASGAAITQARAHYWLGRAAAEAGRDPAAEFARAAAWPTTFYGQLATLALDHDPAALALRIRQERDPAWTREQAFDFAGGELARAAGLLTAWGDPRRAQAFLLRADEEAATTAQRSLAAHLALGLGLPDTAVAIARRMGRDGLMLPEAGWPAPVEPAPGALDPAIVLALIRQESSFDAEALSPAGARGLMQLMPATAAAVARDLGTETTAAALTGDPRQNMRLGTAYLADLLARFGNSLPLAFAAYNAGPARVQQWLAENGDPRTAGGVDMIDWIELIPIGETRNYVERVMENAVIYRARAGSGAPVLLATWSP